MLPITRRPLLIGTGLLLVSRPALAAENRYRVSASQDGKPDNSILLLLRDPPGAANYWQLLKDDSDLPKELLPVLNTDTDIALPTTDPLELVIQRDSLTRPTAWFKLIGFGFFNVPSYGKTGKLEIQLPGYTPTAWTWRRERDI